MLKWLIVLNILIVANNLFCPVEFTVKSRSRRKFGLRLIFCIRTRSYYQAAALINEFSDIDVRDYNLRTPLMYAILLKRLGLVNELIEKGVDLNARDIDGITALTMAKNNKLNSVVQMLILNGAIE